MASSLYPSGKQAFLSGMISLTSDTIKAALINTSDYTYDPSHGSWLTAKSGLVGTPVNITSPTVNSPTPGVFDGDDVTFTAVSGPPVSAIVLYKDAGDDTASQLIAYIDGVSVTPNGGDISCAWDNGPHRIFEL